MKILAHGDLDGIASAFLLKKEYREAEVKFIQPFELLEELQKIDEPVILADLAVAEEDAEAVIANLKRIMRKHQFYDVMVYDHHGSTEKLVGKGIRVVWDDTTSASMLVYHTLHIGNSRLREIALLGAISDKTIDRSKVPRDLVRTAAIISAAIGYNALDDKFRYFLLENLDRPEIIMPECKNRASLASKRREMLANELEKVAIRCDDTLVIRTDEVIIGYAGAVATTIMRRTGKTTIIIFPSEVKGKVAITSRAPDHSDVDLGNLIAELTKKVGGRGGGHKRAAGGMIPEHRTGEFISLLIKEVIR